MMVRGRFRPFTLLHNDMLQGAAGQFFCEPEGDVSVDTAVRTILMLGFRGQGCPVRAAEQGFMSGRVRRRC
jgi:hypothetical protein